MNPPGNNDHDGVDECESQAHPGSCAQHGVRHLFIVSRDKSWLYEYLLERFAGDPKVQIVLDRRIADRRRTPRTVSLDRRRGERRVTRAPADDELVTHGYMIVDL